MDYYRSLDASALDPDFPTFFELLASRQLGDLINPYLRYILVHYAQQNPQYLLKLANYFDEVFLVLFGAVEFGYLRHWNSSFVEKFYGLKRVSQLPVPTPRTNHAATSKIDPIRRLTRKQVLGAVFFAVVVPYIREKAQVRYDQLTARYTLREISDDEPAEDDPLINHWKFQFDMFLLKWYPRAVFYGSTLELLLAAVYLFRGNGPYTIADLVLGTRYSRFSSSDYARHDKILHQGRFRVLKNVLGAVGYALPATLFGVKFLEWWNSSEITSRLTRSGPLLPPPSVKSAERWTGCPICKKEEPVRPLVLETGVICCAECVDLHTESFDEHTQPTCPLTNDNLLLAEFNSELRRWELGGLRRLII